MLLLSTILLQSLFSQQYFNILPHGVSAASALTSQPSVTTNENQDVQHVPDLDYNVDHSMYLRTFTSLALRDGADGAYDQSNQELSPEHSSYFSRGWRDSSSYSRPYAVSDAKTAQTICDSNTPQALGPGWGSTFMSNSQDGNYPSGNHTCIWTIQASTNATGGGSATPSASFSPSPSPQISPSISPSLSPSPSPTPSPSPSPSSSQLTSALELLSLAASSASSPYIIELSFPSSIQLVCGVDYLTVYDGPDTSSPVIAKLCGDIAVDSAPTLYSSGSQMTVVFSTQPYSPGSLGFVATWTSYLVAFVPIRAEELAVPVVLVSVAADSQDLSVNQDFTPRSQHGMAYDSAKDLVYITGGRNSQNTLAWDTLTYTFSTNKWSKSSSSRNPDPRYGHFSFVYKSELYIYGGVTVIGSVSDVWKYNEKQWLQQSASNPDQIPIGRVGPACTVGTVNNETRLYVFGGIDSLGSTLRDINAYNMDTATWTRIGNQNSVGLSGATAVFHEATASIYFFGGMVNQTTRNVITYQFSLEQELWYALAPRVDPFTASSSTTSSQSSPSPTPSSDDDGDDDGDDGGDSDGDTDSQFLEPVWYDAVSGVWTPAGLMGDDAVVMYGGMKPYGAGLSIQDPNCYIRKITVFDLSCRSWATYDFYNQSSVMKPRVNHTMVLRPPGASGGNKAAWTAYIFGGFDGKDEQDLLVVTLDIPTAENSVVNNCRALRWCNMYDDCQNCNPTYCSYISGLCLFDTDKAKTASSPSGSPDYLLGTTADIPQNGTIQELLLQRPDLSSSVSTLETCPMRTSLNLLTTYTSTIRPGEEITFKTYIDAYELDIEFNVETNLSSPLDFRTQNVWEGFMNMYWRADHGLTDGSSQISSPTPPDIQSNETAIDGPIISNSGTLNTSELMDRWTKYSGLDSSPTWSALHASTSSPIVFSAGDPRRFSGYYVYSLMNPNPSTLTFNITVNLLNHSSGSKQGSGANLATLGIVMGGFILGVILLVLVAIKARKRMRERRALRAAERLRLMEEQEEQEEEERRRLANLALASPENLKDMKPIYRVILGFDRQQQQQGLENSTLRHRTPKRIKKSSETAATKTAVGLSGADTEVNSIPRLRLDPVESHPEYGRRSSRARSDFIRDLGSSSSTSGGSHLDESSETCTIRSNMRESIGAAGSLLTELEEPRSMLNDTSSNFSSLPCDSSLRSVDHLEMMKPSTELEIESEGQGDHLSVTNLARERRPGSWNEGSVGDSDVIKLEVLKPYDASGVETISNTRRRNPIGVQPISIEPLPFHGGLVPRTKRHYRRYQRSISRRYPQTNNRTSPQLSDRSVSRSNTGRGTQTTPPQGSLRRAKKAATKMALESRTGAASGLDMPMDNEDEPWENIEMDQYDTTASAVQQQEKPENTWSTPLARMREEKEYEPGPLLAVNVLIVFPGDSETIPVNPSGSSTEISEVKCLPPMAIGTVFAPDPVRWWAYKARQQHDRRRYEREMKRLYRHQGHQRSRKPF
ncbi:Multiple epidermal growth factor-like domains protein 8 [Mortierella sp. AD011]|nr:Multiple epidermal growth factor-like domains protein 8 [Mortierella sp. AD011]